MNQPGFVGRYVLVQGLEQGKFLQMRIETRHPHLSARSFRVLVFFLVSLALLELRARTCGDAFCGSRPHITNRRMARITLRGDYYKADLCVGWILKEEDVEAWAVAHGVKWEGPWEIESYRLSELVGDDGKNIVPPGWRIWFSPGDLGDFYIFYLSWRADNLEKDGGCFGFHYDLAPFLNTTDLKALLEDTDSMARGAALAAEMGNTDPLKIIAVPHVH